MYTLIEAKRHERRHAPLCIYRKGYQAADHNRIRYMDASCGWPSAFTTVTSITFVFAPDMQPDHQSDKPEWWVSGHGAVPGIGVLG
jgi:hypothetical protein